MDLDERWWGYVYPKNLDKHDNPKLAVSQTVRNLEVTADLNGIFSFNNVRVNGILVSNRCSLLFLLAMLNAPVADWVFRRIAKPKSGGFFEANKQFITPLPIPDASNKQKRSIAASALILTRWHTKLKHLEHEIDRRLETCVPKTCGEEWLLQKIGSVEDWKSRTPANLKGRDRTQWPKKQRTLAFAEQTSLLEARLAGAGFMRANFRNGELTVTNNREIVLDRIFVSSEVGLFLEAQWQTALRRIGKRRLIAFRLLDALRSIRIATNNAVKN